MVTLIRREANQAWFPGALGQDRAVLADPVMVDSIAVTQIADRVGPGLHHGRIASKLGPRDSSVSAAVDGAPVTEPIRDVPPGDRPGSPDGVLDQLAGSAGGRAGAVAFGSRDSLRSGIGGKLQEPQCIRFATASGNSASRIGIRCILSRNKRSAQVIQNGRQWPQEASAILCFREAAGATGVRFTHRSNLPCARE
jgi:hypothetical protein